jgi:hypothetical protein
MRQVVGIDRRIKRDWMDAALDRLAQTTDEAELRTFLDGQLRAELPGKESRAKTTGIVLRIWSGIPPERVALRDRAVALLPRITGQERIWLHWGMATLAYPFFRDTAEVVGRLLALQDDFTTAHVQGRMVTTWGDRTTSKVAAQKLITTLVDWEVLRSTKEKGHFLLARKMATAVPDLQLWLLEALLRASAANEIEAQQLLRLPEAFPFTVSVGVADLRRCEGFNIHRQGLDMDMVAFRTIRVEQSAKKPAKTRKARPKKVNTPNLFDHQSDEIDVANSRPISATDAPFAAPIGECAELVREGRFYAGVAVAQALVESTILLVWRVKVRKRKDQTADFSKALESLRLNSFISDRCKGEIDRLWADRHVIWHLRPCVDSEMRRLEETAETSLTLLEDLAKEFFGYSQRGSVIVPDHPEYWAVPQEGTPVLAST